MSRKRTLTLAVACATAVVGFAAAPAISGAWATPSSSSLTVTALPNGAPDINPADVQTYMQQLQTIATNNGGNRYTGRTGYRASVDYIKQQATAIGLTSVTEQSFSTSAGTSYNVTAELPGTDTSKVLMVGAHLDSVSAGPGINDNGSGSSTLLAVAKAIKAARPTPAITIRFGWWGAEELGLLGSKAYVNSLSSTERGRIKNYLNFDMVASPNPGYFVYNDDPGGTALRDLLVRAFSAEGIASDYIDPQGRSDHASFYNIGIPTGGTYSGGDEYKTSAQASKWGGTANAMFDPCYHKSCDTYSNTNATSIDHHADVVSYAVWELTGSTSPSPTTTTTPPSGCSGSGQKLGNPGFESGATVWSQTSGVIGQYGSSGEPTHSGTWNAWMDGYGSSHSDTLSQTITLPTGCTNYTFSFWLHIDTAETTTTSAYDKLTVTANSTTLATYSNLNKSTGYVQKSFSLNGFAGQSVTLKFSGVEDSSLQTSFVVDDTAVDVS